MLCRVLLFYHSVACTFPLFPCTFSPPGWQPCWSLWTTCGFQTWYPWQGCCWSSWTGTLPWVAVTLSPTSIHCYMPCPGLLGNHVEDLQNTTICKNPYRPIKVTNYVPPQLAHINSQADSQLSVCLESFSCSRSYHPHVHVISVKHWVHDTGLLVYQQVDAVITDSHVNFLGSDTSLNSSTALSCWLSHS